MHQRIDPGENPDRQYHRATAWPGSGADGAIVRRFKGLSALSITTMTRHEHFGPFWHHFCFDARWHLSWRAAAPDFAETPPQRGRPERCAARRRADSDNSRAG